MQPPGCSDRLQCLSQAHVIGQQGPAVGGEKCNPFNLVRIELRPDSGEPSPRCHDGFTYPGGAQLVRHLICQPPGMSDGVLAQIDILPILHLLGETEKLVWQTPLEHSPVVKILLQYRCQIPFPRHPGSAVQSDAWRIFHIPVEINVGQRRSQTFEPGIIPPLAQLVEHRLDMFAGAQLVAGKIGTSAVVGTPRQRANMHPVAARETAAGSDGARTPCAKARVATHRLYLHLVAATLDALIDGCIQRTAQSLILCGHLGIGV